MIYVLLDTNIILDMVVDRRNLINKKLLEKFIKLLDSGEIKLIVPEIVKVETYRHLEEEFNEVQKRIQNALDTIKGLYGVATLKIDGLDLSEYKKNARKELNDALTEFEVNKAAYKKDVGDTIDLLFAHANCILIEDIVLIDKVVKRKFYKRAPFHKVEKDSNGDGLITETLINLSQFINLEADDVVFFVTGNYQDFSDTAGNKNDDLHPDIQIDLKAVGLDTKVKYIRSFGQLVGKELKATLEQVQLIEELEKELEAQEQEAEEDYYADMKDLEREGAGLVSMSSFDVSVDEYLQEFRNSLEELYEDFRSIFNDILEIASFYDEECVELLSDVDISNFPKLLQEISDIYPYESDQTIQGFIDFTDWLSSKTNEWESIEEFEDFSNIDFGTTSRIDSPDGDKYELYVEEKYLTLEEGSDDDICISLSKSDDAIWRGRIYIAYGMVEYDEDGGIGDAIDNEVCLQVEDILEQISCIRDEWKELVAEEHKNISEIKDAIAELIAND